MMCPVLPMSESWPPPASPTKQSRCSGLSTSVLTLSLFMIRSWRINGVCKTWFSPGKRTSPTSFRGKQRAGNFTQFQVCLLYTSDAADDLLCVDLGGRRIIKKKKKKKKQKI